MHGGRVEREKDAGPIGGGIGHRDRAADRAVATHGAISDMRGGATHHAVRRIGREPVLDLACVTPAPMKMPSPRSRVLPHVREPADVDQRVAHRHAQIQQGSERLAAGDERMHRRRARQTS